ncbi:MAG: polymer-forming cytoskeletal protein [Thermomicrobiales bacterium]|nr:polymer-forming cytoskeletal protein [Thermomicrobiales bacterium]
MSSRAMDQGNYRGAPQQQPEPTSVIDQYSNFDGTYNSSRDLRVEGQVKGTIVCKGALHIAQGAQVRASVEAESISVAGDLEGEITCRGRLELLPSGRVKGQIATQGLVIHEGAVYEGEMLMGANAARRKRGSVAVERTEAPLQATTMDAPEDAAPVEPVAAAEATAADTDVPTLRTNSFIRRFGTAETSSTPEESSK